MTKYEPKAVYGTSGHDHLAYEIYEQLKAEGYSTRNAAANGWFAACRKANKIRREQGLAPVDRPTCQVVVR